jgi:glucose-1-phosphate thymidylyltransferase
MKASWFIEAIEERQGLKVACVDEIAYRLGYIDAEQVRRLARPFMKNNYGRYLMDMLKQSEAP